MSDALNTPDPDPSTLHESTRLDELLSRAAELEQHDRERATHQLREALALALHAGDHGRAARAELNLATLEWRLSDYENALLHARSALARFQQENDRPNEAWSLRLLGNIHGVQSQYVQAAEYLQAAAALSRETNTTACLASCLNNLGIIASELGDYAASLAYLLEALRIYAPNDQHIPSTLNNVASIHRHLGQAELALEFHRRSLDLARTTPPHALIATFLHNTAETVRVLERYPEALALLDESLALARQVGDRQTEMLALDSLGLTYTATGQDDAARACYDQGLRLAHQVNHPLAEVKLLMHASVHTPDPREMLHRALKLAERSALKAEALEVHDRLVDLHRQSGAFERAFHHLACARQLERELFSDEKNNRIQALHIQYDLARTRGIAESQRTLNEQLRRANEELDAFSYSVAHDLRTPVRHISSFAGLLRATLKLETNEHPRAAQLLTVIEQSAQRLNTLIDAMLEFARHARGPLRVTQVDLNASVQDILADLAPDLIGRHVTWQIGELPVVQGDPVLLRQVLLNLLSNAVKYTRVRAESVIAVRAHRHESAWVVQVQDNGTGFDPEHADKLFGVFQRLHHSSEFEGVGVGLATVQRIVTRHGGQAWAESRPGEGATFSFSLPV